jgi:hypothetical protein
MSATGKTHAKAPEGERARILESDAGSVAWRRWGPYVSDRQWGTVREDYSEGGSAWDSFPFDHVRLRAYRWGEDGIFGFSDDQQQLCLGLALWNGKDAILKERFFGLSGTQGNHGEDVKDYYFYLDATPTHSYQRALYKYPLQAFPYESLRDENARRGRSQPEFELVDTGIFDGGYIDVVVEYAKEGPEDILLRITVTNRATIDSTIHVLPTLWFRNTWSWFPDAAKPELALKSGTQSIHASHAVLGERWLTFEPDGVPLFTENETNAAALWGGTNPSPYVKDGIDAYVVRGILDAVNPAARGTKAAIHHVLDIAPGASRSVRVRVSATAGVAIDATFDKTIDRRRAEADAFYRNVLPSTTSDDRRNIARQAFAGMLWNKQFYRYAIVRWLTGDPASPPPPSARWHGRNREWPHFACGDVISMPDKWEYPWFAAWDLAFHAVTFALIDPAFAKSQLELLMGEGYMHPNGQLPAYEWAFGDVNPPVHAWAALQVYRTEFERTGRADRAFLERMFHKLTMYFTWWVNRKDAGGDNVFSGGFLGLDNIGPFDRSAPLPPQYQLRQSDGTSWMALFCASMMEIAAILTTEDPVYFDSYAKFAAHYIYINDAMHRGAAKLWDDVDGFYYDVVDADDGRRIPLRLRSMVGLIPLFATSIVDVAASSGFEDVVRSLTWLLRDRPDLAYIVDAVRERNKGGRILAAFVRDGRLPQVLRWLFDESEFLSPYGIRALSKGHEREPYVLREGNTEFRVAYEPAESSIGLFGGNSNWRGPVWMPVNYLVVHALRRMHEYYGDDLLVEFPTGSGDRMTLSKAADCISERLVAIFERDAGRRPVFGGSTRFQDDPHWSDNVLFYEYFHGDNGAGIGASHQTGWTGLVANLICELAAPSGEKELDRR